MMKRTQQLSITALCAAAVLGFGLTSCGDDVGSTRGKLNASCSDKAPCENGLVCSDEGICIEKKDDPAPQPEKAKLGEDCGGEIECEGDLVCGDSGKCEEKKDEPKDPEVNPDPCKTANCSDGTTCLNGKCIDTECIDNGAEKTCDAGQMCVKGSCVDDGCVDKSCEDGFTCIKGLCEDTVCHENGVVCNDGTTCVKGTCVDNECLSETCDAGLVCSKGACIYPACAGKDPCTNGKICNEAGECVFEHDPDLVVTANDLETDETGDTAVVSLKLNNPPQADVTLECEITTESSSPEASVSCEHIHFDASNFGEDQTITVTGLPDSLIDEDQKFTVKLTTKSDDAAFNGLTKSLDMVNKNIDTVGLKISADELTTTESGGSASFTISLITKPEADVTITIASSNPEFGTVDGAENNALTLTFTPENWDTPQEVKITGQDDDETPNGDDANKYQITFKSASEDKNYNDLNINPINVTNVDNDVADAFVDKALIETAENGGPVTLTVRLGLEPKEAVTVSAKLLLNKDSDDATPEATILGENKITLDKDSYKEGKTIQIQGVADNIIDGDKDYVLRLRMSSNDSQYFGKTKFIPGKNIDTDTAEISKKYESTVISEDGTTTDIMISLSSIPTAPVTITLNTSTAEELSISATELVFTPENWNVEQKLTVTGEDDLIIDGDKVSKITFRTESEDKNFNEILDELEITTLDNDVAQIIVASQGMELLENSQAKPEFKVMLSAQPTSKVTVKLKSSDESELKLLSPATLIFDPEKWNVPQTVMLQVVDDSDADGTQLAQIDMTSTSADNDFNNLSASTEKYSILDNESASVTLTLAKQELRPGNYTTTMTVALSAQPVGDVTVTLASSNSTIAKLDKTTLTFTPSNWNQAQTVNITDSDPHAAPAAKTVVTLSGTAAGQGQYNGLKSNNAALTIYEFESQNFDFSGTHQAITLLPGNYKLQVWGAAGGVSKSDWAKAGPGGYAEGIINLKAKTSAWVVVGGRGNGSQCTAPGVDGGGGGYNGGGASYNTGWGGGGGTDIRLLKDDLYNRVIVAGGGGGGALDYYSENVKWKGNGGYGGGESGGAATGDTYLTVTYAGATQTSGHKFGVGQDAYNYYQCGDVPYGGGGGGWYGGYARIAYTFALGTGGSGGSGYVNTSASTKPSGYALTSADYFLTSTKLIGGNSVMPSTNGATETCHQGNGYAKITLVD
ncbi:MAG: hypothetical protein II767_08815 [Proteobacteria bacterium]|nr:hypothetical protein [Pseudomonadota bacterium]